MSILKQWDEKTGLGEKILMKKLSSGTKCYIIPKSGYLEKQAAVCFRFGSNDVVFQNDFQKTTTVPFGTAHFLEHKLFEEEWGDAFTEFSKYGADANAFTDFNKTAYYFSCIQNFEKSFSLLLRFVQNPYFKEESVKREKGIIEQEITMYDDDPSWIVFFNMLTGMYHNHTVKNAIAGNIDSIQEIKEETLQKSYEAFYTPENMSIVCVGDLDEEKIFDIAEKAVKKSNKKTASVVFEKEPSEIYKSYVEKNMDVAQPLFHIGFKIEPTKESKSLKRICGMKILFDLIAGNGSDFFQKVYQNNEIEEEFGFEYLTGEGYGAAVFSGSAKNPEILARELMAEIERMKEKGFSSNTFERIKKKHHSRLIRGFNSINAICMSQIDMAVKGSDLLEMDHTFCALNHTDVESMLKECFKKENMVLSVVKKK